jgi:uncharacterized SAM-binding protein YcdF (DUF218 family)
MFLPSKLLVDLLQPLNWLLAWALLALVLLRRRPETARRMLWAAFAALGLLGFSAPPEALMRLLEIRHAPPSPEVVATATGVIVLGGAIEGPESYLESSQVALNESAERMTVPVGWLRRYPQLQLVFTGGEARLRPEGVAEAEQARQFYAEQGIESTRLRFESHSRTTRENAREVARLLGSDCGAQWLLVTSAYHMPRAVEEFRAEGCPATPYPVDFRTGRNRHWLSWSAARNLVQWEIVLHEWVGLVVYRLTRDP